MKMVVFRQLLKDPFRELGISSLFLPNAGLKLPGISLPVNNKPSHTPHIFVVLI
jgi:hypothetical protein